MKKRTVGMLIGAMTMMVGMTANAKSVSEYTDVHEGDWFYSTVADVAEKGYITGTTETTFAPGSNLERGQLATILYRMAGNPETSFESRFGDVGDGMFFSVPVTWANNVGVVKGYDNGNFGASDKITREQLATMLYRYAGYAGYDTSATGDIYSFPDGSAVSGFASESMSWAVGSGLIKGDGGNINPQGDVSRAVAATMISRLSNMPASHTHNFVPNMVTVDDYETVTDYEERHKVVTMPMGKGGSVCACGYMTTYDKTPENMNPDGTVKEEVRNAEYDEFCKHTAVCGGAYSTLTEGASCIIAPTELVAVGSHEEWVGSHEEQQGWICTECGYIQQ